MRVWPLPRKVGNLTYGGIVFHYPYASDDPAVARVIDREAEAVRAAYIRLAAAILDRPFGGLYSRVSD